MVHKRLHLTVTGMVQGVFYRTAARDIATNLMLNGWIKNLKDGSVKILVEGEEKDLIDFLKWAKNGPENATVEDIVEEWSPSMDEFENFRIIGEDDSVEDAMKSVDDLLETEGKGSDHPVHEGFTKEDKHFKQ